MVMMKTITVTDFSLKDTLECGQTFCWLKEGEGYVNPDIGQVVYVEQQGNVLHFDTSDGDVDLKGLLGLYDPVDEIRVTVNRDSLMEKSIAHMPGLRVVRDPFFPCLIAFLCSIRKNIPTIRQMVQSIRETYGEPISFRDMTYHCMPTPEQLRGVPAKELRKLGLGWRAKFIEETTSTIAEREIEFKTLQKMEYEEAHRQLKTLHGVGDKVADCVSLFSLGFLEAFPIDIWIERIIEEHYNIFTETGNSYKKKSSAAREYFGPYAGYAQQYLFHFMRTGC
ncbi:MAG: DNA-3-methyladenine glycosylase [Candidatus Thorarchaeota archaeon]|nr:MAG: DNA-3-methyladenine glycosylase [Candidatus Thorarchaeota archaeon]